MSDLEERTAIKDIRELEEEYRIIMEKYSSFPKLDAVTRVSDVLEGLRYAGRYISRPKYRDLLADWCRSLGRIIYNLSGDFPQMRIIPLDIKKALLAARENQNLNEKVEDMLYIASYLPKEEKRDLIKDAYSIANNITSEENRARALKAISNYFPTDEISIQIPPQIPHPPSDFTGRDAELKELLEKFESGINIIGLRGIGGVGKTALALKLAEMLKDRYKDGHTMVDLRGIGDNPATPSEAMASVIHAYNPEEKIPQNEADVMTLYLNLLTGKNALILLDNALDDKQVIKLLPPKTCGLIVTSRRTITLPGLFRMDLDVLKHDEALDLLLSVRYSASSSERSSDIDPAWQEIARLCGYLPLALRAAASYLANYENISPAKYAKELENERTRLERIGNEGVELGVDASFFFSFQRLDSDTRLIFLRLTAFPSDFDGPAEEQICQDEGNKGLSELVRWSFVDYKHLGKDYGRYRLHDLVRLFALARLPLVSMQAVYQSYAAYYEELLSQADSMYKEGGASIQRGLALFDLERSNVMAGWAWAEKNMDADAAAAELCMNYPKAGAYVLDLRLDSQQKIYWLNRAILAARKLGNRGLEGIHLGNLGNAYAALGEAKKAIEYYDQALGIAREIGDRRNEGAHLGNLGAAYAALGEAKKAIEYHEKALLIAREIGNRRSEGVDLGNLGQAYVYLGDARKAINYHEQALLIDREIGNRRSEGVDLGNLGLAYAALGDALKAIDYYDQALLTARDIGDRINEGVWLGNIGNAYATLGEAKKAIEYYDQALGIAREIGDRRNEGAHLGNLGAAYAALGDALKAIKYYDQALVIVREIGDRRNEGIWLGNL